MNGQLNVTPIESKQPQPSCEFKVHIQLDGFPIEISGSGRAGDLRNLVARLKAIGATPPANLLPVGKGSDTPTCPEHGKAKQSKRPGSYYCPTSLPDGGYCRWVGKETK